jgi:hypothetical protein
MFDIIPPYFSFDTFKKSVRDRQIPLPPSTGTHAEYSMEVSVYTPAA